MAPRLALNLLGERWRHESFMDLCRDTKTSTQLKSFTKWREEYKDRNIQIPERKTFSKSYLKNSMSFSARYAYPGSKVCFK